MLQTPWAITLALLLGLILLQTSPAQATEVDYLRDCEPYYAEGNPNSSWSYLACIKIVHDTIADVVYATASVSTRTPGVLVGIKALHLDIRDVTIDKTILVKTGAGIDADHLQPRWDTTTTEVFDCDQRLRGAIAFKATVGTHAKWPNGVYSPNQNTIAKTGKVVDQVAIPTCQ
jgi:hypothetical protein